MIARKSRDLSTATLSLMAVAIAINITIGSLTVVLRLPLYLDSVGTVLVGALAGPWAGALTGLLTDLVWSLLPIPGGAGPTTAFFAPVAAVIGLMAGFWAGRGVFQLRSDDARIGGFLALALGIAAAVVAMLVVQATVGLGFDPNDQGSQLRFVLLGLPIVAIGAGAAALSRRTVFRLREDDPRTRTYLIAATAISAAALVFALIRLLAGPTSSLLSDVIGDVQFTGFAMADTVALLVAVGGALLVGTLVGVWARAGEHARLFPVWVGGFTTGLVAALIAAPIVAGVFGGVTGGGTDALVALFRTLGLSIFQSALAQGVTSDPLDKTISYTIVFVVLTALPITVRTMFSRGELTVEE
jgi:energy-coupling factor transport system substrate-specific component